MITQTMRIPNQEVLIQFPKAIFARMKSRMLNILKLIADFMLPVPSDLSYEQWQQIECRRSYAYPCKLSEHAHDLRYL